MLGIVAGNSIVYHYLINYVEVRLAEMSIDFEGDVTEVVDILLNVILSGVDTALTAFNDGLLWIVVAAAAMCLILGLLAFGMGSSDRMEIHENKGGMTVPEDVL